MTPTAIFAFVWDLENGQPPVRFFHVQGGPHDRSTVSEPTLIALGIAVPA
jgi:hypothetical protein